MPSRVKGAAKAPKRKTARKKAAKKIVSLKHKQAKRRNIPTAQMEAVVQDKDKAAIRAAYERRNKDLDPQLVWRGKEEQNLSDLLVDAPPLYIQEKLHPKVLMDDLLRLSQEEAAPSPQADMFADFNGLPSEAAKAEFYQHDAHWSNRMILGDSLQAMASLAEREGLRGKVQMIYMDPPYGIKFNSNFQWSTTSRDVKDGKRDHITREPEQVKAFRDTWRDGVHSYLAYLRDRLTVARDLLTESGSVFVQIGDENVHRVRAVMDEVFGEKNFVSQIGFTKTSGLESVFRMPATFDYLLWYVRSLDDMKYRPVWLKKDNLQKSGYTHCLVESEECSINSCSAEELERGKIYTRSDLTKPGPGSKYDIRFREKIYTSGNRWWGTTKESMLRLSKADRISAVGKNLRFRRFLEDNPSTSLKNFWGDTGIAGFASNKIYVVETNSSVIQRCLLMTTDPGDLVLDPTCGSGTTATVAEQWGRRWITMDTSRVSLALARARIMGARYPFYLLADSPEGQAKEAEITQTIPKESPTCGDIRQGFVYQRVPHIMLKSIANNKEIDVIYEKWEKTISDFREQLSSAAGIEIAMKPAKTSGESLADIDPKAAMGMKVVYDEDWKIPREPRPDWNDGTKKIHAQWKQARLARQQEIDASIAAKADTEYLYDKPYEDKSRVRVAGPFTVDSISPHRPFVENENGEAAAPRSHLAQDSFVERMLLTLQTAGVQQAHKEDRIDFSSLEGWPGRYICAKGLYDEGETLRKAAIFIGPEFGTVARADLVAAAREAADAKFDILIACAFSYDAACAELAALGKIHILLARMNADLHMATNLKDTKNSNLFVVFGAPDIDIEEIDARQIKVRMKGVDVFHPASGEVRSDGPDGIAMWFVDSDYNEESFFVRQAYFLGATADPYKSLKTTLKADINQEAWESLYSDISRAFDKPASGRIAVKVINHLGDEVMKVFEVK